MRIVFCLKKGDCYDQEVTRFGVVMHLYDNEFSSCCLGGDWMP